MTISPTFYKQLFYTKVLRAAFCTDGLGLYFFWQKEIGAKAARKMLVKLTPNHVLRFVENQSFQTLND